jgi:diphthine-ammonia ligase
MDAVALISGGKDSIYACCEAVRFGHSLVALANLYPASTAIRDAAGSSDPSIASAEEATGLELPSELDSFFIQTVGHTAVEAIAKAMQLPLIRRQTQGKSVNSGLAYEKDSANADVDSVDEVEDLFELLKAVKTSFPSIKGVICGAILSNYQRLRVEHVAQRLGLTVISYLWQREQKGLLQDMVCIWITPLMLLYLRCHFSNLLLLQIDDGIEAILIKVSSYGLTTRMLGQNLSTLRPSLLRLVRSLCVVPLLASMSNALPSCRTRSVG